MTDEIRKPSQDEQEKIQALSNKIFEIIKDESPCIIGNTLMFMLATLIIQSPNSKKLMDSIRACLYAYYLEYVD